MKKTISEKLISDHCGKDVRAGDYAIVNLDFVYMPDSSAPLTIDLLNQINIPKTRRLDNCALFIDHCSPSPRIEMANWHKKIRQFANSVGAHLNDIGDGILHQVAVEKYIQPGWIVVGGDSHTCTLGAIGALGTGMGSTDIAVATATGKIWMRVPETLQVRVEGQLPIGVYPKDLILHIIGNIGSDGATYDTIEFCGTTIKNMDIEGRLTLSNMVVECGAKFGVVSSDKRTKEYLQFLGRSKAYKRVISDVGAKYKGAIQINASQLTPVVSSPHAVDNVKPIEEVEGISIDQVFVGSCTNGRAGDIRLLARILSGKKVHSNTRLIVMPASRRIFLDCLKDGSINTIVEAGGAVNSPGCGPCGGIHLGILGENERCLSTTNRNFRGRMGDPSSYVYLASPATAAATALYGKITDPRNAI